jgi:DNA polymerase III alpha subunit (gram-positive type)
MPNKNSIEFYGNDHVMIDIETLGTNTDTVVTQIAAVSFNPIKGTILSEFNVHIDIQDALNEGFTVSASTILWWFAQDEDARLNLIEKNKTGLKVRDALLVQF